MDPETREYLEQLRGEFAAMRGEFAAMREEMGSRFRAIDSRFDGVDSRFDGVDSRLDRVDSRFDGVDSRFDRVDSRFEGVDSRFDSVDRRIEAEHETTRRYFDVVAEDLRHDVQTVAEGVLSNTRAIDELRFDVYRDMNARFGTVDLAFVDLQRQLAELRDRGAAR